MCRIPVYNSRDAYKLCAHIFNIMQYRYERLTGSLDSSGDRNYTTFIWFRHRYQLMSVPNETHIVRDMQIIYYSLPCEREQLRLMRPLVGLQTHCSYFRRGDPKLQHVVNPMNHQRRARASMAIHTLEIYYSEVIKQAGKAANEAC